MGGADWVRGAVRGASAELLAVSCDVQGGLRPRFTSRVAAIGFTGSVLKCLWGGYSDEAAIVILKNNWPMAWPDVGV